MQGVVLHIKPSHKIFKMGIKLSFVEKTTSKGNVVKVAKVKGTLKRLSDQVFSYQAEGENGPELVEYKLANIEFTDLNNNKFNADQVHVYKKSYEQGMSIGETYLGSVTRSQDANGNPRQPWWTLSSLPIGATITDSDFDEVEESVSKSLDI